MKNKKEVNIYETYVKMEFNFSLFFNYRYSYLREVILNYNSKIKWYETMSVW